MGARGRGLLLWCGLCMGIQLGLSEGAPLSPGSLLVAYCGTDEGSSTALDVAGKGANVIAWFFGQLVADANGQPAILHGPNRTVVADAKAELDRRGLSTTHLLSIGGWDAPHPDTRWTGAEWFRIFEAYNVDPATGARIFDGIDWDMEGNDFEGPDSRLSPEAIAVMGDMSRAAKAAGYVVSMAPAQSYFDADTAEFGYRLDYPPAQPWHQDDFPYAGRNSYAYLFMAYPEVFDFVSIQLYESYAPANYAVNVLGQTFPEYIASWTAALDQGFAVDFSHPLEGETPVPTVANFARLPRHKLVVGLIANDDLPDKTLFMKPEDLGAAWAAMEAAGQEPPRGAMYWLAEEDEVANMASGLNAFLHTRAEARPEGEEIVVA